MMTPMTGRATAAAAAAAIMAGTTVHVGSARTAHVLAERACSGAWSVVASPAVPGGELDAVAPRAGDDVWAVGAVPSSFAGSRKRRRPLVEHWDGRRWTVVPSARVSGELDAVAAIAADDAWAVGWSEDVPALIEHWDGRSWNRVAVPWPARLRGVAATSATDVWAVGSNDSGALVLHWDGTRWSRVARRQKASLEAVVALSATDVWAVGGQDGDGLLALHWNGVRWRAFVKPGPGDAKSLDAVAAFSSRDVWAVGSYHEEEAPGYVNHGVVLHWNGSTWTHKRAPQGRALLAVAAGPPHELWVATFDLFPFAAGGGAGTSLTRLGAQWDVTELPRRLVLGLARQPGGTVWGVGLVGSGIDEGGDGFPIRTAPLVLRSTC